MGNLTTNGVSWCLTVGLVYGRAFDRTGTLVPGVDFLKFAKVGLMYRPQPGGQLTEVPPSWTGYTRKTVSWTINTTPTPPTATNSVPIEWTSGTGWGIVQGVGLFAIDANNGNVDILTPMAVVSITDANLSTPGAKLTFGVGQLRFFFD